MEKVLTKVFGKMLENCIVSQRVYCHVTDIKHFSLLMGAGRKLLTVFMVVSTFFIVLDYGNRFRAFLLVQFKNLWLVQINGGKYTLF